MSMLNLRRYVESFGSNTFGVEGIYTCQALKDGVVVRERTFPNLLTNLGLDALGAGDPNFIRMQLGTGTTTPAVTDTALAVYGQAVSASSGATTGSGVSGAPPYYGWLRLTWTSSVGGATGNWTEIGISSTATTGNLRSRALILDGGGSPTTFPVLADEQFQGTYEFRVYAPASDSAASITLSGSPYNTITRAVNVNSTGAWTPVLWGAGASPFMLTSVSGADAYTGALAAVTAGQPGGSSLGGAGSFTNASYTSGTYYRQCGLRWGSGQGVGTIRSLVVPLRVGWFQVEYSPTIAKLTTQEFIHNQQTSWARR